MGGAKSIGMLFLAASVVFGGETLLSRDRGGADREAPSGEDKFTLTCEQSSCCGLIVSLCAMRGSNPVGSAKMR